jgi:hypothetical protein
MTKFERCHKCDTAVHVINFFIARTHICTVSINFQQHSVENCVAIVRWDDHFKMSYKNRGQHCFYMRIYCTVDWYVATLV